MQEKKEIEIKLLFRNKKSIITKLGKKMKLDKELTISDKYYSNSDNKADMSNKKKLIRIRNFDNKVELTYKGNAFDNKNIWHRTELTTEIKSPEIMEKILDNLGFKKISEYKSKKEYWHFDNIEIVFAKFSQPAPLEFMEIEGTSEKKIKNVVKQLGNNVKEVGEEIFKIFDDKRKART
jgi:predicted adenylyl cyclase CyaB